MGALNPFATEFIRPNVGIRAALDGPILIEGNQVLGSWEYGIFAGYGTGKTVRKNQVSTLGFYGIYAAGDGAVLGNVVTGDARGIGLEGGAKVVGNAVSAAYVGIIVHGSSPFTGVIESGHS